MPHYTASVVTAGPTPQHHVGLNYNVSTYTVSETLSGSLSIAMAVIPGGARVVRADVAWDNNAINLGAESGWVTLQGQTGGTNHATLVRSASLNATANVALYTPEDPAVGYRFTSSSIAVLKFSNLTGSGTAATTFTVALTYDCQKQPD